MSVILLAGNEVFKKNSLTYPDILPCTDKRLYDIVVANKTCL